MKRFPPKTNLIYSGINSGLVGCKLDSHRMWVQISSPLTRDGNGVKGINYPNPELFKKKENINCLQMRQPAKIVFKRRFHD